MENRFFRMIRKMLKEYNYLSIESYEWCKKISDTYFKHFSIKGKMNDLSERQKKVIYWLVSNYSSDQVTPERSHPYQKLSYRDHG